MANGYRGARYGLTFRVTAESLDRERAECQRLAEAEEGDMPEDEGGPFSPAAQAADAAFREMCRRVDAQRAEMLGAGEEDTMSHDPDPAYGSGEGYSTNGPAEIVWSRAVGALVAQLPHQCSEWVIGGPEEIRALVAHLEALLPEFDHPERYRHTQHCVRCGEAYFEPGPVCTQECLDEAYLCVRCFYPAQDERREACRATHHPETACVMPWCLRCLACRTGCRCPVAARAEGTSFI